MSTENPDLHPYTAFYTEPGATFSLVFKCEAVDADHAEEQCLNAYPDCTVAWINEGDNEVYGYEPEPLRAAPALQRKPSPGHEFVTIRKDWLVSFAELMQEASAALQNPASQREPLADELDGSVFMAREVLADPGAQASSAEGGRIGTDAIAAATSADQAEAAAQRARERQRG